MGLDNGICVRGLKRNSLIGRLFKYPFDEDYGEAPDICYWRKCWNIRGAIFSEIEHKNQYENYRTNLSRMDVKHIREWIKWFLANPDEWHGSIWEFSEIEDTLKRDSRNLLILYLLMGVKKGLQPYFYDSY